MDLKENQTYKGFNDGNGDNLQKRFDDFTRSAAISGEPRFSISIMTW